MTESNLDLKKYHGLIQIVFGSNEGLELLKQLEQDTALVFDKNTNVMYTRVGEHGLIQGLKQILNLSVDELNDLTDKKNETKDSLFNDDNF